MYYVLWVIVALCSAEPLLLSHIRPTTVARQLSRERQLKCDNYRESTEQGRKMSARGETSFISTVTRTSRSTPFTRRILAIPSCVLVFSLSLLLPLSIVISLHNAISYENSLRVGLNPLFGLSNFTTKNSNKSAINENPTSRRSGSASDTIYNNFTSLATSSGEVITPTTEHNDEEAHNITSVPRILWFTYKDNILDTKEPNHLYQNVLKTIAKYTESFRNQDHDTEVQVKSLNDDNCKDLVEKANPSLVQHFLEEQKGMFRGDICRVAALYLHGGYYFDLDMQVHTPYIAPRRIESSFFVTSYDAQGTHFFQSFLASTPYNPILKEALGAMLEYYEQRNSECNKDQWCYMGVVTLKQAFDRVVLERREVPIENTVLLSEIKLEPHIYPDFPRRPGVDDRSDWFCNYIVHDPKTKIVHFYSRIPGTQNCP